jgi:predicted acetyltransferase
MLRLHHAQVTVSQQNVAAARDFYLGTLGLHEISKPASLRGRGGFWARIGEQELHVSIEEGVDRLATKAHLAYQVSDLTEWRLKLLKLGMPMPDNAPIPGYDRLEFRDPFGNRIELIQPLVMLVTPDLYFRDSFLIAVEEFRPELHYQNVDAETFDDYVAWLNNHELRDRPPRVPETFFWLVYGDLFIGRLSIRHRLNENLERFGGHIGYEIRPTERKKGYGSDILSLGLEKARAIGLTRAMLTCDVTNIASRRIIEKNGGVLQDQIQVEGHPVETLRWWIDL